MFLGKKSGFNLQKCGVGEFYRHSQPQLEVLYEFHRYNHLVGQILLDFREVVILSLARICFKVLLFILT